jgi:hypothetical protein
MSNALQVVDWGSETLPFAIKKDGQTISLDPAKNPRALEYTDGHVGFAGYLMAADLELERISKMPFSIMDMPDYLWRDAYDDEVEPAHAVEDMLEDNNICAE